MINRRVLTLFAKAPVAGKVKTRLISKLGVTGAQELYERLLCRSIEIAENVPLTRKIFYATPESSSAYFHRFDDWQLALQQGDTIGDRMADVFSSHAAARCSVVLLGSDICDFTKDDLEQAFRALESGFEVVIGPSHDGGYWLIGSRLNTLPVFENIMWSSARVFNQTRTLLARSGVSFHVLPIRHDIDTPKDLRFLRANQWKKTDDLNI